MNTVWKYILNSDTNVIDIPEGYSVLSVVAQRNQVVLYCLVNPLEVLIQAKFRVVGTGWELEHNFYDNKIFVGTVKTHAETYVWHVFEVFE